MKFIVISDDLSGAAGMASMLGTNIPVIVYDNLEFLNKFRENVLSIDLETRNSSYAREKLEFLTAKFPGYMILTRIDTMLRGSTYEFMEFMSLRSNIAITDTIPEYGRYTSNGFTIYKNEKKDVNHLIPSKLKNRAEVLDSSTYDDLYEISRKCIDENLVPVDPGPLIAIYLEMIL